MTRVNYCLIAMLSIGLLASCGRKVQTAVNKEAKLPYKVSADRPILNGDLKIHPFLKAVEQHPPNKTQVPVPIQKMADWEVHKIITDQSISTLQSRINRELIYFHLLDLYLLPVYQNTGDAAVEETILNCLVQLNDMGSFSELHLQARALHSISQGGFKYPGLEEDLLTTIESKGAATNQSKLKEAKQLITNLQDHKLN